MEEITYATKKSLGNKSSSWFHSNIINLLKEHKKLFIEPLSSSKSTSNKYPYYIIKTLNKFLKNKKIIIVNLWFLHLYYKEFISIFIDSS